jgi:hypothetical protein
MDCSGIQERLSEYIDGALDEKTAQSVEKHMTTCKGCKEMYASLSAVVKELNALEPMAAPADILEKIHQRMKPRPQVNRFFKKLFFPFKVKIPLQLAAAATVCILVVLVIHLQQSKFQMIQPYKAYQSQRAAEKEKTDHIESLYHVAKKHSAPVSKETPPMISATEKGSAGQRSGIQSSGQGLIQTESRPASPMSPNAGPSAGKSRPIELALVLKTGVMGDASLSRLAMKAAQMRKSDEKLAEKESVNQDGSKRNIEPRQSNRTANFLSSMTHILSPLQGSVLSVDSPKHANGSGSILVQIPAKYYDFFCKDIGRLASFKTPPPALSDKSPETVTLLIKVSSQK